MVKIDSLLVTYAKFVMQCVAFVTYVKELKNCETRDIDK